MRLLRFNASTLLFFRGMSSPAGQSAVSPKTKVLTLCFVFKDESRSEVLLGLKKRGFGCGRFNGFGGKVEPNETIRQAAIREVKEESGLDIYDESLLQAGRIYFEFVGDPLWLDVHVFVTDKYAGTVTESDEMRPSWYAADFSTLPFDKMWPDDRYWFPFLLTRVPFFGYFQFLGHDKITRYTIKQLSGNDDSDFNDTDIPWNNNDVKNDRQNDSNSRTGV